MSNPTNSRLMMGDPDFAASRSFSIVTSEKNQVGKKISGFIDGIRWDFTTYSSCELVFHIHPFEHPIAVEFLISSGEKFEGNEEACVRYHYEFLLDDLVRALRVVRFKGYTHLIHRVLWDDETGDTRWVVCSVDGIEFRVDTAGESDTPGEIHVTLRDWMKDPESLLQEIRMRNVHNQ